MVFLDKILNGTKKESGINSELNKVAQNKNQRLIDGEEERRERIRLGQDIETYYIGESRRNGFPYDCFFDWEYEMVERAINAKQTLAGTLDVIECAKDYIINNRDLKIETQLKKFNLEHAKVWIELLISMARNGSSYAKAAISGNYFKKGLFPLPEIEELICEIIDEDTKKMYFDEVQFACETNDKAAMVAYAFFVMFGGEYENERRELYLKAGQLGSSEAYYQLFFTVNDPWNSEEGFKYAVAAAECDDGEQAYFFQGRIGEAYYYGDGWNISIDKAEGLRWYRRAAANGYVLAIRTLEMLKENA